MEDFEKLGVFYIGREYDLPAKKQGQNLILYDSRDMVTHGVCVGMTGSGKTGLCIAILEEAVWVVGIGVFLANPVGRIDGEAVGKGRPLLVNNEPVIRRCQKGEFAHEG